MNTRINLDNLVGHETFVRFERMNSYVVPAGVRHQIVIDGRGADIGIAISHNGREDFRVNPSETVYWYGGPHAYIVDVPLSFGKTVKLE